MNIPIQAPPVMRMMPARPVAAVVAQDCFGDCLLNSLGFGNLAQQCSSSSITDIAQCLFKLGAIANPEVFVAKAAAFSAYCGSKCAY